MTTFYIQRQIRELWLLKGGESVRIIAYNHFGRTISKELPLEQIQPLQGRGNRSIQLRIKSYRLSFNMDKRGVFPNPTLYDFSAGMGRKLH